MQRLLGSLLWALVLAATAGHSQARAQHQLQLPTLHSIWIGRSQTAGQVIGPQRERRQATSKPSAKKSTKSFELDCLHAHNKYRRLHQAGELIIDNKVSPLKCCAIATSSQA